MSKFPKRVDVNQKEIVAYFRKLGASVQILSEIGKGCPDILVGIFGQNFLFEIKDGTKPPSGQKLTPSEEKFFNGWLGHVEIISTKESALKFVQDLTMLM